VKDITRYHFARKIVINGSMTARMIIRVETIGAMGLFGEEVRGFFNLS
jgi:hypothetical protein